jgi:pentatricopeptide repeat protein
MLTEMKNNHAGFTNVIMTTLIDAFVRCKDIDRALATFEEMKKLGLEPDDVTFGSVLDACGHYGKLDELKKYWSEMVDTYNIKPTETAFASKIEAFLRNQQLSAAADVMEEFNRADISPSPKTFFTFLKYFLKNFPEHERVSEAEKLLDPIRTATTITISHRAEVQKFIRSLRT